MALSQMQAFPTPVGMNRNIGTTGDIIGCVPHACGDEPIMRHVVEPQYQRSPRLWG